MDGGSFINLDLTTVLLIVIPLALIAGALVTVRWITGARQTMRIYLMMTMINREHRSWLSRLLWY